MEEIDIIELLKRVKEGKAPNKIEIDGSVYKFKDKIHNINELYGNGTFLWFIKGITLNTKIKILDKPIIEKLKEVQYSELKYSNNNDKDYINLIIVNNRDKINEIINYINNKE